MDPYSAVGGLGKYQRTGSPTGGYFAIGEMRSSPSSFTEMIAPEVMTRTKDFNLLDQIKISASGRL